MEPEILDSCPECGGDLVDAKFETRGREYDARFCERCDYVFLTTDELLEDLLRAGVTGYSLVCVDLGAHPRSTESEERALLVKTAHERRRSALLDHIHLELYALGHYLRALVLRLGARLPLEGCRVTSSPTFAA